MNRRMAMGGDTSLNVPMREDGEGQWQDWLADDRPLQDEVVADAQEADVRHEMLTEAMDDLNEREKHILTERRLTDDPKTLEELSQVYGVSARARPPDRGPRVREAAKGDDAHRRRQAAARRGVIRWPALT